MTQPPMTSSIEVSEEQTRAGFAAVPNRLLNINAAELSAIYLAMKAAEPLQQGDEAVNDLVVRLTEHAIMELDADEENTLQIEAWGKAAEREIRAALVRSKPIDRDAVAKAIGRAAQDGESSAYTLRMRLSYDEQLRAADAAITAIGSQSIEGERGVA